MNVRLTPDFGHRLASLAPCNKACALVATAALLAFFGLGNLPAAAQAVVRPLEPIGNLWDSGKGFDFDLKKKKAIKARQSVSGIACNLDAQKQRICLLAFDEGVQARYAYVGPGRLRMDDEAVALRVDDGELDAEAAATDGRFYYVAGSHSAKRGDCASNPHSRHVIRFRLDPATGRALRSANGVLVNYADSSRLWAIMQAQPGLAPFVGEQKCLGSEPPREAPSLPGRQGVNIEGMAVQGGRLYFGFRGPALEGTAQVLALDAEALFNPAATDPKAVLTGLTLGRSRGIRDMVAVKDGFLLLAGPDDSEASKEVSWTVWLWDGQPASTGKVVQPRLLATLDLSGVKLRKCDKELKPEAITVLEETPAAFSLLVLSDGMCDGGPLLFRLAR